jgi:uncharacterized protein (UPF0335 family)
MARARKTKKEALLDKIQKIDESISACKEKLEKLESEKSALEDQVAEIEAEAKKKKEEEDFKAIRSLLNTKKITISDLTKIIENQ